MSSEETVKIVKTPEVLHGQPRIEGERIGVRSIGEKIRRNGQSIDEVIGEECYPFLSREQVEAALQYYDDHPEEMASLRAEEEAIIERLRERSRAPEPDADA
jgi:uncharacterized protein (DUF433 family)